MTRGSPTLAQRVLVLAAIAWTFALPTAALAAATPHPSVWTYSFAAAIYAAGSVVCHQLPERSFYMWGRQLPVCARCVGLYAGATVAAIAAAIVRRRAAASPLALVLLASLPAAATLVFEWTTGITPSNGIRAASGVVAGAAVGWVVVRSLADGRVGAER